MLATVRRVVPRSGRRARRLGTGLSDSLVCAEMSGGHSSTVQFRIHKYTYCFGPSCILNLYHPYNTVHIIKELATCRP